MKIYLLIYFFILFFLLQIKADNKYQIKLLHADYAIQNKSFWLLKGNIILQHKNYKITCNSVKYYINIHKFIGEGNIHIIYLNNNIELYSKYIEYDMKQNSYQVFGDSMIFTKTSKLTSNIINYNDNTKLFRSFSNSCFKNSQLTLISDEITYDIIKWTISYSHGSNIYFKNNIFFSKQGIYFIANEKIYFKNIYITNKYNTLFADKILYNINLYKIQFFGPTLIINNKNPKNFIYANFGIHYLNENTTFLKNNYFGILSFNNKIINAKNIFFDHKKLNGYIKDNIVIEMINQHQYLIGGYGEFNNKFLLLTNKSIFTNILKTSKIFISSDAFLYKSNQKQIESLLYAYNTKTKFNNILISSNDLIYNNNIIKYRNNAQIFLNKNNKIFGKIIYLILHQNNTLDTIKIQDNTLFINSKYKEGNFNINYIFAPIIEIFFNQNKIKKILFYKTVKTAFYNLYKRINNNQIFGDVELINSNKLLLDINKLFTNIFFIGQAKSIILFQQKIHNKKVKEFINLINNNIIINMYFDEIINYIKFKKYTNKYIQNIKQNFLIK